MNNQDFQGICSSLLDKYDSHTLTDQDVDIFADIISNVLDREELRGEGTEYEKLSLRISYDYENDIAMNPLLARMYELCRMYEHYRKRPLTEMKEQQRAVSEQKPAGQRKPAIFSFRDGNEILANCWWEDLGDCAGIATKAAEVATAVSGLGSDVSAICRALSSCGCGFDPLDMESKAEADELGYGELPQPASRKDGIIAIGDGIEQNRARRGGEVKFAMDEESIHMDSHLVYGLNFYRELIGDPEFDPKGLPELMEINIDYRFDQAEEAAADWNERLGDTFAIPGSNKLVGVKKAIVG